MPKATRIVHWRYRRQKRRRSGGRRLWRILLVFVAGAGPLPRWAIALVTVLSAPTFAREADGEALAWKYHCVSCHGERGVARSPQYPMLVGQNAAYLEARLRYFRAEEEPGNVMNGQAAPLSDEEIEALARYFSGQS